MAMLPAPPLRPMPLMGVTDNTSPATNERVDVAKVGTVPVVAGAAFAYGDPLTSDSQGRAIKASRRRLQRANHRLRSRPPRLLAISLLVAAWRQRGQFKPGHRRTVTCP
jgi:hypothetical protein